MTVPPLITEKKYERENIHYTYNKLIENELVHNHILRDVYVR